MGINPFRRGKSARRGMTVLAAATLDRLRHNAYCLTLDGASYRSPKMAPAIPKSRLAKQVKSAEI